MFDAIARTDFPRRFIRSLTIWLLRSLGFTLVAAIGWLAAPAISHATPIDYIFSGASVNLGGIPETISGSFIVDPASGLQFGANIQLIGAAPFAPCHREVFRCRAPTRSSGLVLAVPCRCILPTICRRATTLSPVSA